MKVIDDTEIRYCIELPNGIFNWVFIPFCELSFPQTLSAREVGLTGDRLNATFFNKKEHAESYKRNILKLFPHLTKKDVVIHKVKITVEY